MALDAVRIAIPVLGSSLLSRLSGVPTTKILARRDPEAYRRATGLVEEAGDLALESRIGLSSKRLSDFQKRLLNSLRPSGDRLPRLLDDLSDPRRPAARTPFVELKGYPEAVCRQLEEPFRQHGDGAVNPYPSTEPLHGLFEELRAQAQAGEMPILIDLDGDPQATSADEVMARQAVRSLGQRQNELSLPLNGVKERHRRFHRELLPALPGALAEELGRLRSHLEPDLELQDQPLFHWRQAGRGQKHLVRQVRALLAP